MLVSQSWSSRERYRSLITVVTVSSPFPNPPDLSQTFRIRPMPSVTYLPVST